MRTEERVISAFVDIYDHEPLVERARAEERSVSAELRLAIREHLDAAREWWCADFMLDRDVTDDVEFEVGQAVSVGLTGQVGTYLSEVSVVRSPAVPGAEITRRFALEPKRAEADRSPAAVRASCDRAAAGEVVRDWTGHRPE